MAKHKTSHKGRGREMAGEIEPIFDEGGEEDELGCAWRGQKSDCRKNSRQHCSRYSKLENQFKRVAVCVLGVQRDGIDTRCSIRKVRLE